MQIGTSVPAAIAVVAQGLVLYLVAIGARKSAKPTALPAPDKGATP
jgi:hypothetical protein